MTEAISSLATFSGAVRLVCVLAGVAALVNALELLWLRGRDAVSLLQGATALILMTRPNATASALLVVTTYLTALRYRGNVNGGSDAMLFTTLGGLTIAQVESASMFWRETGLLYVAAQLVLSYLRAGIAKARQPSWWTGQALGEFLALPAYGVPHGRWWSTPSLLRIASVAIIVFECASPIVFVHPRLCALFIAAALCFHVLTALLFGLNRFLLTWAAALPSLWYAVHRAA